MAPPTYNFVSKLDLREKKRIIRLEKHLEKKLTSIFMREWVLFKEEAQNTKFWFIFEATLFAYIRN